MASPTPASADPVTGPPAGSTGPVAGSPAGPAGAEPAAAAGGRTGTGPARPAGEHPVLAAARRIAPMAAAAGDEIETSGRLPAPLAAAITEAGLNHLFLPASAGGPEVDPVTGLLAMEVLASADGSTAWCAHVSSANAWQLASLSPEAVAAMAAITGPLRSFSGSARPCGQARPVEGGFVVNGRWDFASNCLHAQWYCGTCVVEEPPVGRRRLRPLFMPITDGEILDTWQVAGLRGTGSNDFEARDVFVPAERASAGRYLAAQPSALYHQRLSMVVNWALTAGVALGLARGALDTFREMATERTAGAEAPLRDRAPVQLAVGRAEARLGAARAWCLDTITAAWEAGVADRADPGSATAALDATIPPARLAIPHALATAVEVVDALWQVGGTRSIFRAQGLERFFRDARVAAQHGAGSFSHFEAGGRLALGLPAAAPLW